MILAGYERCCGLRFLLTHLVVTTFSLSSCVQALRAVYRLVCARSDFVTSVVWWDCASAATKFVYHLSKVAACARPSRQLAAVVEKQPSRKDFPDTRYNSS